MRADFDFTNIKRLETESCATVYCIRDVIDLSNEAFDKTERKNRKKELLID